METKEIREVLVKAFGVLNESQRVNLKWHREKRSSVLCGSNRARMFFVDDGIG